MRRPRGKRQCDECGEMRPTVEIRNVEIFLGRVCGGCERELARGWAESKGWTVVEGRESQPDLPRGDAEDGSKIDVATRDGRVFMKLDDDVFELTGEDAIVAGGNMLVCAMVALGVPPEVAYEVNRAAIVTIGEHAAKDGPGAGLIPLVEQLGEGLEIDGDLTDDDVDEPASDDEPVGAATAGELLGDQDEQPDQGEPTDQGAAIPPDDEAEMIAAQAAHMARMRAGQGQGEEPAATIDPELEPEGGGAK